MSCNATPCYLMRYKAMRCRVTPCNILTLSSSRCHVTQRNVIGSTRVVGAVGPHQPAGRPWNIVVPRAVARGRRCSWPSQGLMGAHRAHHPGRFLSPTRGKQGFPQRFQGPGSMWPHRKKILTNQNALFRSISHQPCPRVGVV